MSDQGTPPPNGGKWFRTTRWSLVKAAAESRSSTHDNALADLCRIYWPPVYAYVRSRGHDADAAQDLAQGFFAQLLEKKFLKAVRQERGRFRSFLLTCVKHYLSNEWDRARAQKRGGGENPLPLDMGDAENQVAWEPADPETPDSIFEREWTRTLMLRVFARLENEAKRSARPERIRKLLPYLTKTKPNAPYKEIAVELEMSEGAVKVAVHNLRKKLADILREEVADTVSDPKLIEDEIQFLFSVLDS